MPIICVLTSYVDYEQLSRPANVAATWSNSRTA